jgi:peptidoglycan/LPS O-acetylase OafA/YrhL
MAGRAPYDVEKFLLQLIASVVYGLGSVTAFTIDGADWKSVGFKAIGVLIAIPAVVYARRAFATRRAGPDPHRSGPADRR